MSSDDQPGWAAPQEPGTFIPPSWQTPTGAGLGDDAPVPAGAPANAAPGPMPMTTPGPMPMTVPGSMPMSIPGAEPKKKRGCLRKVLIGIGVLIVLFAALMFWFFKWTSGPEKEARAFVNEVVAGDADAAYARTAGSYREKVSKLDFATGVEANQDELGGADVSGRGRFISSRTGCPSTAVMTYRLESASSRTYARIVLQKVGGAWKVVNSAFTAQEPTTDLREGEECRS